MNIDLKLKTKYNVGDPIAIVDDRVVRYDIIEFVSINLNGYRDEEPLVRHYPKIGIAGYTEAELDKMREQANSLYAELLSVSLY